MKRKRKLLSLVLTLALVLGCVNIPVSATFAAQSKADDTKMKAQVQKSGTLGEGDFVFKWTLDDGGTLKITGKGFLFLNEEDLERISNDIKKIAIADGITGAYFPFGGYGNDSKGLPSLKELSLAATVKELDGSFRNCPNLEVITGGKNIKEVSNSLFDNTKWLSNKEIATIGKAFVAYNGSSSNVAIPNGITTISDYAFRYNETLRTITLPKSLISIGDSAFKGCTSLSSINGGDNLSKLGTSALEDVPWVAQKKGTVTLGNVLVKYKGTAKTYTVPSSIKSIYDEAFSECKTLESVSVKSKINTVPIDAFRNCVKLKDVTLPKSVTTIAYGAFDHCTALQKVTLPSSLKKIETGAFIFCKSLSKVEVNGGANNTKLNEIGYKAFGGCTKLKSLTIPKKVYRIDDKAFGYDLVDDGSYDQKPTKMAGTVIYGVNGTEAQKYAKTNAITFKSVKDNGKDNEGGHSTGGHSAGTKGKVVAPAQKTKNGLKGPDFEVYIAYWESHRFHEVKFSEVEGATGYQIYYSFTGKSGSWKKAASPKNSTVYWDFEWSKGKSKTCYYKIRAYNKVNGQIKYGAFSKVIKIK